VEWPPHPPLDFSLFGLNEWSGARWVEFFEGEIGEPVWAVTLAHSRDPALVLVRFAPTKPWDRRMAGGLPGATAFACSLLVALIDMARPELDGSEHDQYNRSIWAFAQEQAKTTESWEQTQWGWDGHTVPARIRRFAHAWTGFTLGVPGHYVGVTAFNLVDPRIDLIRVNGADYGFDFTVPFRIDELNTRRPQRLNPSEIVRSKRRLPDHDEVLASTGPASN
jgi:hypothetical protein